MGMTKAQKEAAKVFAVEKNTALTQIFGFGDTGGWIAPSQALTALIGEGFVDQGPAGTGEADSGAVGTVAVRCSEKGKTLAATLGATKTANETGAVKTAANISGIVKGIAIPEGKRGGNKGKSLYNFDAMDVGDTFFIAATAEVPNPAKSLASTATSATRRYDVPVLDANGAQVMEAVKAKPATGTPGMPDYVAAVEATTRKKMAHTRIFVMRAVTDGAPWGEQWKGIAGAVCGRKA